MKDPKEVVKRIVLELGRKDREKRKLVRIRGRLERDLEEVEGLMEELVDGGSSGGAPPELLLEKQRLEEVLDETYLSIDQLSQEREVLLDRKRTLQKYTREYG